MKALKTSAAQADAAVQPRGPQLREARPGDAERIPPPAMLQAMLEAELEPCGVRRLPLAVSLPITIGASVFLWSVIIQGVRSLL